MPRGSALCPVQLCGNALSLLRVDENGEDIQNDPIIFAEWSPLIPVAPVCNTSQR